MALKLSQQLSSQRFNRTQRVQMQEEDRKYFESLKNKANAIREGWGEIKSLDEYSQKYASLDPSLKPFFQSPQEVQAGIDSQKIVEKDKAQKKLDELRAEMVLLDARREKETDKRKREWFLEDIKELQYEIKYFDISKIDEGYSYNDVWGYAKARAKGKYANWQNKRQNKALEQQYIKEGYTPVYNQSGKVVNFLNPERQIVRDETTKRLVSTYNPLPVFLQSLKFGGGLKESDINTYQTAFKNYEKVGYEKLSVSQQKVLLPNGVPESAKQKTEYVPIYAQGTIEGVGGKLATFSPVLIKTLTEQGMLKTSETGEYSLVGVSGDVETRKIVTYGGTVEVKGKTGYKYGVERTIVNPEFLKQFIKLQNIKLQKQNDYLKSFDDKYSVGLFNREDMYGTQWKGLGLTPPSNLSVSELDKWYEKNMGVGMWSTELTPSGKPLYFRESKSFATADYSLDLKWTNIAYGNAPVGMGSERRSNIPVVNEKSLLSKAYERLDIGVEDFSFGLMQGGSLPSGVSIEEAYAFNEKMRVASIGNVKLEKSLALSKNLAKSSTVLVAGALAISPAGVITYKTLTSLAGLKTTAGLFSAGALGLMGIDVAGKLGREAKLSQQEKDVYSTYSKEIQQALREPNQFIAESGWRLSDPFSLKDFNKATASYIDRKWWGGGTRVGSKEERLYELGIRTSLKKQGVPYADLELATAVAQSTRVNKAINAIEKAVFVEALTETFGRLAYNVYKAKTPIGAYAYNQKISDLTGISYKGLEMKYKSHLLDVATRNIAVGGFAEGSLGDVIYSMDSGNWNPYRTVGIGVVSSYVASNVGRTIVKSSMRGQSGLSQLKLSAGYGLDYPMEFAGDKAVDLSVALVQKIRGIKLGRTINPKIFTPSSVDVGGKMVDVQPSKSRSLEVMRSVQNIQEAKNRALMIQINSLTTKSMAVSVPNYNPSYIGLYGGALSSQTNLPSNINIYDMIPATVPSDVMIPNYNLVPSSTSLIVPTSIDTPLTVPTTIPTIMQTNIETPTIIPTIVPNLDFPALWGGFYKGKRVGKRKKYLYGSIPDFTARVLGFEREQAKSVNDLMKKITKLQTGLEIRRGVRV